MNVEDMTQEDYDALAKRLKETLAKYRKLRGDDPSKPADPQHPPEEQGIPADGG